MRPAPEPLKMTFLLPDGAAATPGFHQPSPEGCTLEVQWPLVAITGPSRRAVLDHAARLLRLSCRHLPPISIAAMLSWPNRPTFRDRLTIIVGADVAFSPTGMDPEFPSEPPVKPPSKPPPGLRLVEGGRSA